MKAGGIITYVVRILLVLLAPASLAQVSGEALDELQTAIVKRDAAKVRAMIGAGIPVDVNFNQVDRRRTGETPLGMSINRGHLDIARILLEAGADPNRPNDWGQVPMNYAKTREAIELLVKHGANIDARNHRGYTALAEAVERGESERVKLLLASKAQPETADLLGIAVERRHVHLVPLLLEHGADPRKPATRALWQLIELGDEATARLLIDKGADPNARNGREWILTRALQRQRWSVVDGLVDAGANLRLPDGAECADANRDCDSIILARVATLNPPTLARMKARGLDVNARAASGHTALTALIVDPVYGAIGQVISPQAMARASDIAPRVRALLDQGTDANISYRGLTPLMIAIAARPQVVDMLVDAGGRVEFRQTIAREQPAPAAYPVAAGQVRLPSPSEPLIYNNLGLFTGMTAGPLTWVALQRQPRIAARLLARERRLEPEDRFLPYFAGLIGEWDIVLQALPYASDVDAGDRGGVTALMLAAHDGRADVVKALLARKAKVNARSARDWPPFLEAPAVLFMGHPPSRPRLVGGYTPLKAANERGHAEVASLLRAAGGKE